MNKNWVKVLKWDARISRHTLQVPNLQNLLIGGLQLRKGRSDPKWAYLWPRMRYAQNLIWPSILHGRWPAQNHNWPSLLPGSNIGGSLVACAMFPADWLLHHSCSLLFTVFPFPLPLCCILCLQQKHADQEVFVLLLQEICCCIWGRVLWGRFSVLTLLVKTATIGDGHHWSVLTAD